MTAALAALALTASGCATTHAPASLAPKADARVEHPEFTVELRVRSPSSATVDLSARGDFHVNADYPIHFQITGGARIEQDRFQREPCTTSADTCRAHATVPAAGARAIEGTLAFSVCDAERCLIEKVPLRLHHPP